ncbi:MAG: S1C family serine protease [Acutalibacter sp.]|jgi:serine protease Do
MYNDPYQNNNQNNTNNTSEPLDQDKAQEVKTTQETSSYTAPSYHAGGQSSPSSYPTQTSWQYGGQNQTPNTYTWNGAQPGTQPSTPYYQPPKPKKPRDTKKAKKFALRAVAAVLCCAVVSLGSVGVFAAMIQNGVVNIQSTGSADKAAFTLYKQAETSEDTSNVVTTDNLTRQQAAQKVIPSVVCIQNYQISTDGFFFSGNSDGDNTGSLAGEGSGIIISDDGYIVTNQHVVSGASNLEVVTSDGVSYEATLVGEDTQTDLAVIKIDATGLTAAEFADSGDLQVGDEVMAVGNPGGLQLSSSVTFGYVSALNRPVTNSDTGYTINCIQTDAAINPGNSGGALVDMNGRVVGINSSKIAATEYEGLGFAIPSDTVQPIVTDLRDYGYVKDRPMLGITGTFLNALQATWNNVPSGFLVNEVSSEEATKSGLQRNDIITAIDDTQVTSTNTIATYIADKKPGDTVTLTVYRYSTGESLKIDLVLSENTGLSNQSSNS